MNEKQYHITKQQLKKFQDAVDNFKPSENVDPILSQAELDGLISMRDELSNKIKEYERNNDNL